MLTACAGSNEAEPACDGEGVICTFLGNGQAGLGHDGQSALEVSLYLPQDLTFGPDGLPYVLDWNNHRVRTLRDGKVETVIGTGRLGDAMDGPALKTSLNHPTHVAFDAMGRLILSAWHNSKVMRYDPDTEMLETLCGDGKRDFGGDDGDALKATLDLPVATAFDLDGNMLIMDQANQRIRRVDSDGVITTVVGPNKRFEPAPDYLRQVCTTDAMTKLETCKLCKTAEADDPACAGRKPQGFAGDGGPGSEVLIYQPFSQSAPPAGRMEMSKDGTLYFCDTGNHRVRSVTQDGIVKTVAGSGPATFDLNYKGGHKGDGGPATKAQLMGPTDVAVGRRGSLYIADTKNDCVRKVDAKGIITTLAGQCGQRGYAGDGGLATEALLNRPYGVALDADGNLYIADTHNHRIRVIYGVD
jgi:sugar lactone lactonase YvrE